MNKTYTSWQKNLVGWLCLAALLLFMVRTVPPLAESEVTYKFFFLLGALGIWRYGMAALNFVRGMYFLYLVYPRHCRQIDAMGSAADPDALFVLVTSFRIDTPTTIDVYRSIMEEARQCTYPVTIVASLVEYADEALVKKLWQSHNLPAHVSLKIIRIKGSGKRDALAYGFRSIAKEMPTDRSVVAVVDGDTIVTQGALRKSAKFFALFPQLGGLTTDEFSEPRFEDYFLREFHRMRFSQRHISMASMALSNRVLTMTGRMSLFRGSAACNSNFMELVQRDNLDHWRLGRFRFLTGDDKSTWYSLMLAGWDTYYVPDVKVITMEYSPHPNFFTATRMLMFRWSGNSLRQNIRATNLGPGKLGWFTYWTLWDQRIAMWTTLFGPVVAIIGSIKYSIVYMLIYLTWVLISRIIRTLIQAFGGHRVGPLWPVLMFYNQLIGAVIKIDVLFNLNKQSWTRQKTTLESHGDRLKETLSALSSKVAIVSSVCVFVALVFPLV
ncbi:MAG: glycosyltransferase family 2 protein [Granulosicoccus sp.]|nr:glycosyltransferase family 2 protein [Granulosicoccus sp.]